MFSRRLNKMGHMFWHINGNKLHLFFEYCCIIGGLSRIIFVLHVFNEMKEKNYIDQVLVNISPIHSFSVYISMVSNQIIWTENILKYLLYNWVKKVPQPGIKPRNFDWQDLRFNIKLSRLPEFSHLENLFKIQCSNINNCNLPPIV